MIAGWDRSVVAGKERLNSGGATMVIRDIPAVPTGSYVELYGTLTCYLVFLYDFPFPTILPLGVATTATPPFDASEGAIAGWVVY